MCTTACVDIDAQVAVARKTVFDREPIDIAERFWWEPSDSVERIRIWLTDAP